MKRLSDFLSKRRAVVLLSLLIAISLVRFYRLGGGIVLGEPDEVTHQELMENFRRHFWPSYSGGSWYYQLPLYPFSAYLLSYVFPDRFMSLRVISALATTFLVFGLYSYLLRRGFSVLRSFYGSLLFSLSPFTVFYSRVGMLDASVVAYSFLSLIFFDLFVKERKMRDGILAGTFLGLGILTKYSALIFLIIPLAFFILKSLKRTWKTGFRQASFILDLPSFLVLVPAGLIALPPFIVLYLHDRFLFKNHLMTNLGLLRDQWFFDSRSFSFFNYGADLFWWLTYPIAILSLVGLVIALKRWRSWYVFLLYFALTVLGLLYKTPFYPRYFLLAIPFLSVLSLLAYDFFSERLLRVPWLSLVLSLVIPLLILPTFFEAFRSTNHLLIESAAQRLGPKTAPAHPWLFSTYWPNFVNFLEGNGRMKVGWLADNSWETSAFTDSNGRSALEILATEGGLVAIEDLYSSSANFKNPLARVNARSEIESKYSADEVIGDRSPNFPHYKAHFNKVSLYYFPK